MSPKASCVQRWNFCREIGSNMSHSPMVASAETFWVACAVSDSDRKRRSLQRDLDGYVFLVSFCVFTSRPLWREQLSSTEAPTSKAVSVFEPPTVWSFRNRDPKWASPPVTVGVGALSGEERREWWGLTTVDTMVATDPGLKLSNLQAKINFCSSGVDCL